MYYYMCIFLTVSLFSVGIILLKHPFFSFATATAGLLNSMLGSDKHEAVRQKHLIQSLGELLPRLGLLLLLLALIVGVSFIPIVVYLEYNSGETVGDLDMRSFYFFLSLILGSLVLFIVPRARRDREKDYSGWFMLLHRMVLDNYNISATLFKLEKKLWKKKAGKQTKDFVIVTGLARGGASALTKLLFDSGRFHTLSRENMPFLLSVNLWRKFYHPRALKLKQSTETLEEYFFKVYLKDSFISEPTLTRHVVDPETFENYLTYQKLIADKKGDSTYLAKNNNLILRYNSLRSHNPEFKIALLFRNPVPHAYSLQSQHLRFSEMHEADPFTLEYMNWLGQHEFGLNHKVFDLEGMDLRERYGITSINYWLSVWISYYSYVLTLARDKNLFLIEYTDLCKQPGKLAATLGSLFHVDIVDNQIDPYEERELSDLDMENSLLEEAVSLYQELRKHKVRI